MSDSFQLTHTAMPRYRTARSPSRNRFAKLATSAPFTSVTSFVTREMRRPVRLPWKNESDSRHSCEKSRLRR